MFLGLYNEDIINIKAILIATLTRRLLGRYTTLKDIAIFTTFKIEKKRF